MPDMTSAAVVAPEPDFVVTGVDTELPISRDDGQSSQDSWDAVVNQLIEWANPRPLIDDGVDAPTRITLMLAGQLVGALKHADREAPARMRRDPNGGILFEYRHRQITVVYHVWDDGTIDRSVFRGNVLENRVTILDPDK